jgi:hypothetical protein
MFRLNLKSAASGREQRDKRGDTHNDFRNPIADLMNRHAERGSITLR